MGWNLGPASLDDKSHRDALDAVIYRLFAELLAERLRATNEERVAAKQELEWLQPHKR